MLAPVVAVSGAFATATEIPILAVKKALASYIKKAGEKKAQTPRLAEKQTGIKKKTLPAVFFARPSLIKLKNMGAVEVFFENIKKGFRSGSLF